VDYRNCDVEFGYWPLSMLTVSLLEKQKFYCTMYITICAPVSGQFNPGKARFGIFWRLSVYKLNVSGKHKYSHAELVTAFDDGYSTFIALADEVASYWCCWSKRLA
jgi:hypothetical protein